MVNIFSAAKRHKKISLIILTAILVGGYFLLNPDDKNSNVTVYTYGSVSKGNIMQSVSGTGQVSVADQVDVKAKVAGDVVAVSAVQGRQVKAGEVLARFDSTEAQKNVRDAQISLDSSKLTLKKMLLDNTTSISQAKKAVKDAQDSVVTSQSDLDKSYEQAFNTVASFFSDLPTIMAAMDDIINGSNSSVVQTSGTYFNYYQDQINAHGGLLLSTQNIGLAYQAAKSSYNTSLSDYKTLSRYSDNSEISKIVGESYTAAKDISNAIKALSSFIQLYRDTLENNNISPQSFSTTHLSTLSGYLSQTNSYLVTLLTTQQTLKDAALAVNESLENVDEKKQDLQSLEDYTNPLNIQAQELSVSQKESTLSDAKETLTDYTITAPIDGIIADVSVKAGDSLSANEAVATIIANQQIAEITLNEVDVAAVKVGQKATMTFDAVSDLTLTGYVSEVDAIGTVSQGVVSYNVTIAFDTQDERVKPGMSVAAAIITNVKQNVLLVPNTAVKSNAGGNYVLIPVLPVSDQASSGNSAEGQSASQQAVVVGISDDDNTEISSGLNEGDTVIIKTAVQAKSASQSGQSSGSVLSRILGGGGPGGTQVKTTNTGSSSSGSNSSKNSGSSSSGSSQPMDMGGPPPGM